MLRSVRDTIRARCKKSPPGRSRTAREAVALRSFARSLAVPEAPAEPLDRRRPTLSGDLREMFRHAPVFRRRPNGYDRFQVDTYVRWAEEEIAAAGHEREVVLQRHARLRAD